MPASSVKELSMTAPCMEWLSLSLLISTVHFLPLVLLLALFLLDRNLCALFTTTTAALGAPLILPHTATPA